MSAGRRRKAIVTGGARGIGRAIALTLAGHGFDLALVDVRAEDLERTAAELRELGSDAVPIEADTSLYQAARDHVAALEARWGSIDVLVNNAAVLQPKRILEITEEEWDRGMAVNLKGYFNWSQAVAPGMLAAGGGRIVNISSVSANSGPSPHSASRFAYSATKAGVLGLTRGLARELAPTAPLRLRHRGAGQGQQQPAGDDARAPRRDRSHARHSRGDRLRTLPLRRVGIPARRPRGLRPQSALPSPRRAGQWAGRRQGGAFRSGGVRLDSRPATKVAALQRGEVDFVQRVPFDYLAQLRRDPNIRVPSGRGVPQFMGVVQVNQAQPPFDNPLLRQAVQQLMDQPEYLAALGLPSDMFLPRRLSVYTCASPYASEAGAERLGDPSLERARALMRQAGYAGQPVVLLQSADVPIINTFSLVTIDRMQRAGFNVQVRSTDWSSIAQQRWNRNPPGSGGWSVLPLIWAAEDLTTPLSNYPIANNCRNYPGWACDEPINDLLTQFGAESDLARRREIAAQIQAHAHESVSLSLAGQFAVPPAYRANLTGMIAAEVPVFWNVRREGH